jgi:hypothetical protein
MSDRESFSYTDLFVGDDWSVNLDTHADRLPSLTVNAGPASVTLKAMGCETVTESAVAFARDLLRNVEAFTAEVERLRNRPALVEPEGLAPQPVALVGFDLKGGVEFTPYAPRMSALATTRAECGTLLDDLVRLLADRMRVCRQHGARNIWRLPEGLRPVPVVVLVDEVAELFLMADKSEKDAVARTGTALLRVAQLGRAFGSTSSCAASGSAPTSGRASPR